MIKLEINNAGALCALVPHRDGTESSVLLPTDPAKAILTCRRILAAQANAARSEHAGLTSSRQAPTQWDVDREAALSTRYCPECQFLALRDAGTPPDAECPRCDGIGRVPSITLCPPGRGLQKQELSLDDLLDDKA